MKKAIHFVYISIILIMSICLAFTWNSLQEQRHERELLCQVSVAEAYEGFKNYAESGSEDSYLWAVAEFRTFMQTHYFIYEDTPKDEHLTLNEIFSYMALNPEEVKANINELVEALDYLDEDYKNPNGYLRLRNFYNHLQYDD